MKVCVSYLWYRGFPLHQIRHYQFVKAFRLQGERIILCQSFDMDSDLSDAVETLWTNCHDSLTRLGAKRHALYRCASDMRSILDDILNAFDKLDADEAIPPIFCEACDLSKLPPLLSSSNTAAGNMELLSSISSLSEELVFASTYDVASLQI